MKNKIFAIILFFLAFTNVFAQKYYDDQWKKVAENYKNGKYKSNLPIILEIQNQAMKDDNANQLIRSLKAEFSIVNQTTDDTKNDSSSQFFKKLSTFGDKLKGENQLVYQVLLGEFFSDYYNQNQWKINQKTNINNQDFAQIETWSKLNFKNYLAKYFSDLNLKSAELKQVQMSKYKEIFNGTEDLDYFPTLLDWNSLNNIAFLKNSQLFTPNELKENHSKILTIYDELIAKNTGNSKLYFQHQKINYNCGFSNCKDQFSQLQNLVNSQTEGDYKVLIMSEMMDLLVAQEKPKEALSLAETAKKEFPKSPFLNQIKNKENQITNPNLTIKFEAHTQANLPIQLVADAKNISKFSLNI
ncbi:MAG: hypothetical protein WBY99_03750, partial [Kaistella sp.]